MNYIQKKNIMDIDMINIIDYFHKAPYGKEIDFKRMNAKSMPLGYVIHPDCCTKLVWNWLETLTKDYNATFYKEWYDVVSKNRLELFLDQIIHYATTYGTDFTMEGNGYVPNDGSVSPEFKTLKVIEPISTDEIIKRCEDVLISGIALKDSTMKCMCDFIKNSITVDKELIDSIKNREAQAYLSFVSGVRPSDEFGLLRCLMYTYTGKCMIIKDSKTIFGIKMVAKTGVNPILDLTQEEVYALSKIFKRFKPLFLAMKNKNNRNIINRMRKMSDKTHTPLKTGFWENIVSVPRDLSEIRDKVEELDNFRKVRLIQCVNVALFSGEKDKFYVIRNGKSFVRKDYCPKYDFKYLLNVKTLIEKSLIDSLSKKSCRVRFPKWFDIKLPSSEKSFIGNYPFGTSVKMTESNVFGIYWQNDWGTRDFDFSVMDFKGHRISWCSNFYDKGDNPSIVFSGDMTNANPFATELMYVRKDCPDSILNVNQFNGNPKSRFRFFFANEEPDMETFRNERHNSNPYMVNPNNIKFDVMIDVDNERQKSIGLVHDNTITLMDCNSGNGIITRGHDYELDGIKTLAERTKCYVELKDTLILAGFTEVGENEECDLDFSDMDKDTLINLLKN